MSDLRSCHVSKSSDFSLLSICELVHVATRLKCLDLVDGGNEASSKSVGGGGVLGAPGVPQLLAGKVMAPLFFEDSSRTFCSFVAAMQKLGGGVVELNLAKSSISKGESIEDTIRTVSACSDVVVLRHPDAILFDSLSKVSTRPLINAGNGTGEHPTQALLDILTMVTELRSSSSSAVDDVKIETICSHLCGKVIALVGDLKNGRTVHSLARALTNFEGIVFYLVAPPGLEMPVLIVKELESKGFRIVQFSQLSTEVVQDANVIYMTRVQKERFGSPQEYEAVKGTYTLTPELMCHAKPEGEMIIMHPLPRNEELPTEIDSDRRAKYFDQMRYGLYARMALLLAVLGRAGSLLREDDGQCKKE